MQRPSKNPSRGDLVPTPTTIDPTPTPLPRPVAPSPPPPLPFYNPSTTTTTTPGGNNNASETTRPPTQLRRSLPVTPVSRQSPHHHYPVRGGGSATAVDGASGGAYAVDIMQRSSDPPLVTTHDAALTQSSLQAPAAAAAFAATHSASSNAFFLRKSQQAIPDQQQQQQPLSSFQPIQYFGSDHGNHPMNTSNSNNNHTLTSSRGATTRAVRPAHSNNNYNTGTTAVGVGGAASATHSHNHHNHPWSTRRIVLSTLLLLLALAALYPVIHNRNRNTSNTNSKEVAEEEEEAVEAERLFFASSPPARMEREAEVDRLRNAHYYHMDEPFYTSLSSSSSSSLSAQNHQRDTTKDRGRKDNSDRNRIGGEVDEEMTLERWRIAKYVDPALVGPQPSEAAIRRREAPLLTAKQRRAQQKMAAMHRNISFSYNAAVASSVGILAKGKNTADGRDRSGGGDSDAALLQGGGGGVNDDIAALAVVRGGLSASLLLGSSSASSSSSSTTIPLLPAEDVRALRLFLAAEVAKSRPWLQRHWHDYDVYLPLGFAGGREEEKKNDKGSDDSSNNNNNNRLPFGSPSQHQQQQQQQQQKPRRQLPFRKVFIVANLFDNEDLIADFTASLTAFIERGLLGRTSSQYLPNIASRHHHRSGDKSDPSSPSHGENTNSDYPKDHSHQQHDGDWFRPEDVFVSIYSNANSDRTPYLLEHLTHPALRSIGVRHHIVPQGAPSCSGRRWGIAETGGGIQFRSTDTSTSTSTTSGNDRGNGAEKGGGSQQGGGFSRKSGGSEGVVRLYDRTYRKPPKTVVPRIEWLACLRNAALLPLLVHGREGLFPANDTHRQTKAEKRKKTSRFDAAADLRPAFEHWRRTQQQQQEQQKQRSHPPSTFEVVDYDGFIHEWFRDTHREPAARAFFDNFPKTFPHFGRRLQQKGHPHNNNNNDKLNNNSTPATTTTAVATAKAAHGFGLSGLLAQPPQNWWDPHSHHFHEWRRRYDHHMTTDSSSATVGDATIGEGRDAVQAGAVTTANGEALNEDEDDDDDQKNMHDDDDDDVLVLFFNDIYFYPWQVSYLFATNTPVTSPYNRQEKEEKASRNTPREKNHHTDKANKQEDEDKKGSSGEGGSGNESTRPPRFTYDMACAMDFYYNLYDTWVLRGMSGLPYAPYPPYAPHEDNSVNVPLELARHRQQVTTRKLEPGSVGGGGSGGGGGEEFISAKNAHPSSPSSSSPPSHHHLSPRRAMEAVLRVDGYYARLKDSVAGLDAEEPPLVRRIAAAESKIKRSNYAEKRTEGKADASSSSRQSSSLQPSLSPLLAEAHASVRDVLREMSDMIAPPSSSASTFDNGKANKHTTQTTSNPLLLPGMPVRSCWNGVAALRGNLILQEGLRFRYQTLEEQHIQPCVESECKFVGQDIALMALTASSPSSANLEKKKNGARNATTRLHRKRTSAVSSSIAASSSSPSPAAALPSLYGPARIVVNPLVQVSYERWFFSLHQGEEARLLRGGGQKEGEGEGGGTGGGPLIIHEDDPHSLWEAVGGIGDSAAHNNGGESSTDQSHSRIRQGGDGTTTSPFWWTASETSSHFANAAGDENTGAKSVRSSSPMIMEVDIESHEYHPAVFSKHHRGLWISRWIPNFFLASSSSPSSSSSSPAAIRKDGDGSSSVGGGGEGGDRSGSPGSSLIGALLRPAWLQGRIGRTVKHLFSSGFFFSLLQWARNEIEGAIEQRYKSEALKFSSVSSSTLESSTTDAISTSHTSTTQRLLLAMIESVATNLPAITASPSAGCSDQRSDPTRAAEELANLLKTRGIADVSGFLQSTGVHHPSSDQQQEQPAPSSDVASRMAATYDMDFFAHVAARTPPRPLSNPSRSLLDVQVLMNKTAAFYRLGIDALTPSRLLTSDRDDDSGSGSQLDQDNDALFAAFGPASEVAVVASHWWAVKTAIRMMRTAATSNDAAEEMRKKTDSSIDKNGNNNRHESDNPILFYEAVCRLLDAPARRLDLPAMPLSTRIARTERAQWVVDTEEELTTEENRGRRDALLYTMQIQQQQDHQTNPESTRLRRAVLQDPSLRAVVEGRVPIAAVLNPTWMNCIDDTNTVTLADLLASGPIIAALVALPLLVTLLFLWLCGCLRPSSRFRSVVRGVQWIVLRSVVGLYCVIQWGWERLCWVRGLFVFSTSSKFPYFVIAASPSRTSTRRQSQHCIHSENDLSQMEADHRGGGGTDPLDPAAYDESNNDCGHYHSNNALGRCLHAVRCRLRMSTLRRPLRAVLLRVAVLLPWCYTRNRSCFGWLRRFVVEEKEMDMTH